MTQEQKTKISNSLKGRKPWNFGMKGTRPVGLTFKGRKHTAESIEKTRAYFSGRPKSLEQRKKLSISHVGKTRGSNNGMWKGGITRVIDAVRTSFEYRQWRSDVFTRDNFVCQECGDNTGGNLEAHHIKYLSQILVDNSIVTFELARECAELWNTNNGKTLCQKCHIKTHSKK